MSSTPQTPDQQSNRENRRLHARRRIDYLAYASFGPGNGGILINLSESGASFQGIAFVRTAQILNVSLKLPGTGSLIEARGEVVWSNDSEKGGGLRFIDLSEEAHQRLRDWLASDGSSSANFAEQVTPRTEPARTLIASHENPIQSSPMPAARERLETVPVSPEPPANYIRPNFSLAPEEPPAANIGATHASMPSFILADYPQSQRQTSRSPRYVLFGTGVLAGCIGVLAAIAGVHMLTSADRPTILESLRSAAAPPVAGEGRQNSPVDGTDLHDKQMNDKPVALGNQSVDGTPVPRERIYNKMPPQEVAAIAPPPSRPELNLKPFQDSRPKTNPPDRPNLALLGPRMPAPRPTTQVREPLVTDNAAPAFISTEEPRLAAPNMPDLPKPPRPSAAKPDRPTGFMDAVLIQRNPPVYPASAMKKHIEGSVTVNATIGTDGVPRGLRLVSGDPILGQAAQEAISQWRYVPAVSGGVPVESQVAISINFQSKP
jgi:TonB family protein